MSYITSFIIFWIILAILVACTRDNPKACAFCLFCVFLFFYVTVIVPEGGLFFNNATGEFRNPFLTLFKFLIELIKEIIKWFTKQP
jgi:hypothetical protein